MKAPAVLHKRLLTLSLHEFLPRFLLPLLPSRFVRIRYFGFLASRQVKLCCRFAVH